MLRLLKNKKISNVQFQNSIPPPMFGESLRRGNYIIGFQSCQKFECGKNFYRLTQGLGREHDDSGVYQFRRSTHLMEMNLPARQK